MRIVKPIVFFDLETTGVNTSTDRIVQVAMIKMMPDGSTEKKKMLINPGMPIPKGATDVHGITDEMVKGQPTFKQVSKGVASYLKGCDLGGYNSDEFDVPLLIEEFARAGINFPEEGHEPNFVDVFKVERIVNSHKLTDTYKRYTGIELDGAHDAMIDVEATIEVLKYQIELLSPGISAAGIDDYCQGDSKRVDYAGLLYSEGDQVYWGFGKHKDELVSKTVSYANWVLGAQFPKNTKDEIRKALGI